MLIKKCPKCGIDFPARLKIDGKIRTFYKRQYCLKCSPFGKHNTRCLKDMEVVSDELKICTKCGITKPKNEFYKRYSKGEITKSWCKECHKKDIYIRQNTERQQIKKQCVDYLGGVCLSCGYNKEISALDFHHRDGTNKEFVIASKLGRGYTFEDLKPELDKCDLLCCRCHRELHRDKYIVKNTI